MNLPINETNLQEGDSLNFVSLCNESDDVLLTSGNGFALRFPVTACPKLSTSAIGCKVRLPLLG